MEQETVFKEVLGVSPTIKVLEYLLEWKGYDITLTDIARGASIGRKQAYDIVDRFVKQEILSETRKVGASTFYILNKESPVVKDLSRLFNSIIRVSLN